MYPHHLCRQYPRIIEFLRAMWLFFSVKQNYLYDEIEHPCQISYFRSVEYHTERLLKTYSPNITFNPFHSKNVREEKKNASRNNQGEEINYIPMGTGKKRKKRKENRVNTIIKDVGEKKAYCVNCVHSRLIYSIEWNKHSFQVLSLSPRFFRLRSIELTINF